MKIYLLIFLTAANSYATNTQTFVCDMRDLKVNDTTTGLYQLQVSQDSSVLQSGIFENDVEVATLTRVDKASESSTVFIHQDENGRIQHSFDLMPSGDTGILIWRNYDWQKPNSKSPINMSVHICNKK